MSRLIAVLALSALTAAVALGTGSANAQRTVIDPPVASARGVGGLRLGRTIAELRAEKLIGAARKGCELSPGERVAPLRAPLEGFAIFYPKDRLTGLTISAGAETATGIEAGDTIRSARQAYPGAPYDKPGQVRPFQQGFLWIGGRSRPKMTLLIEPDTHRVGEIDIPNPSFCE